MFPVLEQTDTPFRLLFALVWSFLKLPVAGIEAILEALFRHHENTDMALARLAVRADLLKMKGTPSLFLTSFLKTTSRNTLGNEEPDVSFGGAHGSEQAHRRQLSYGRGKERAQSKNPMTKASTKRNKKGGQFMAVKKSTKKFKGVRREK